MTERTRFWLLTGLIGLAFALRVCGLDFQSLWRDEVDVIRFATGPLSRLARLFVAPGQNGPLYYLAVRPWLELAGRSEFSLRFVSAAFGTLAIPLIYRLGRRLFPTLPHVPLVAALLAATSPYLVWYGQEGKMYALVVVLILLSMERYLAALELGGWHRWLLYVVSTSVAFYVHLIAALVIPAQVLVFLFWSSETRKVRWKPWLASIAVLVVPYLPLLRWQLPLLLDPGTSGYDFVPLHRMLYSLLTTYSLGVIQRSTVWSVALFVGALLASALLLKGTRSRLAPLAVLVSWLLIPPLAFFLITLIRPMYTARYLIFVLPAFLLLLAAGVVAIARQSRLLAGFLLVAVLAANGLGMWLQAREPIKTDFRAATNYLVGRMDPDDLILFQIPYGRYSFDYYREQYPGRPSAQSGGGEFRAFLPLVARQGAEPYRWAEGLYTNAGMDLAEVHRRMREITAGSGVVWMVATEVSLWDKRGLVKAWLDDHARLTNEAQFARVAVYRYVLP
ncbi:MAG: glycosyltransferase family 39 protein [Anaerolineae bacterium]